MREPTVLLPELFRRVLWQFIHSAMQGLWRYARERGISISQLFILQRIYANTRGGCNVSLISEQMGVSNAAISQTLDLLVQEGLVTRTEDPQDRRHKRILLTDQGEKIVHESLEAEQTWLLDRITDFSDEERALLTEALQLLLQKIEVVT